LPQGESFASFKISIIFLLPSNFLIPEYVISLEKSKYLVFVLLNKLRTKKKIKKEIKIKIIFCINFCLDIII
jgi:hypothetical protein